MADPKLKFPEDPAFSAGRAARQGANAYGQAQRNVVKSAGNTLVKPFVSAVNAATPFVRGFTGAESPASAGTARTAPAPAATGAAPASAPVAQRPAAPAAPVPQKPTLLAPVQVRAPVQTGRHGERVYNNETLAALGMTPSADAAATGSASSPTQPKPLLQQPIESVVARPTTAPAVRDSTQFALAGQRSAAGDARADAAQFLNPMSNDGEIMRRFEISQGYGSNKGSPQARRMAGEAILGQLGARNEASATGQAGANATLQQGAQGEGVANESAAQRRLDADQFNVTSAQTTAQRLAEQQRPSQVIRDISGQTSVLRNDGTASTLRNEEGNPILTPAPTTKLDTVTADTQYKTLADRLTTIEQFGRPSDPAAAAEYDRATSALQAQMQQLAGTAPRAGQPPAEAIAELKANPNAAADFDAVFGEGAAATYLNR